LYRHHEKTRGRFAHPRKKNSAGIKIPPPSICNPSHKGTPKGKKRGRTSNSGRGGNYNALSVEKGARLQYFCIGKPEGKGNTPSWSWGQKKMLLVSRRSWPPHLPLRQQRGGKFVGEGIPTLTRSRGVDACLSQASQGGGGGLSASSSDGWEGEKGPVLATVLGSAGAALRRWEMPRGKGRFSSTIMARERGVTSQRSAKWGKKKGFE